MEFVKMHGLGNDFICLDHFLFQPEMDYPETARRLCHRQFGIGADGLLVVLPSEKADARMRIFNPDGSEPEMCGNGIRCLARYLYDAGYVRQEEIAVETRAGILTVRLKMAGAKAVHEPAEHTQAKSLQVEAVTVRMGEPDFGQGIIARKITAAGRTFRFTAVSMGNPHCVIFLENLQDWENLELELYGPALENHEYFPQKTNVEFAVAENDKEITMKVWERGAGPTLACGTGACACLAAAVLEGRTGRNARVHLPGGDLQIEWREDNQVYMTGPARYVFRGSLLENGLQ